MKKFQTCWFFYYVYQKLGSGSSNLTHKEEIMIVLLGFVYSGAAEPNAQGCAFAHPIFGSQVNQMMVLCTQNFGLSYKLRTQSWTASAIPVTCFLLSGIFEFKHVKKMKIVQFIYLVTYYLVLKHIWIDINPSFIVDCLNF